MKEPLIQTADNRVWQNWHDTSGVGGTALRFFTPSNFWSDGTTGGNEDFTPGLAGLQSIVRQAEAAGKRVRAVGSGWSLSNAAFTEDYLVNTALLSRWRIGVVDPAMVEEPFQDLRNRLVLAQCGVQIKTLNSYLERQGLALPTSGASNGQTIVGAISTGTHGSAHDVGAIHDCILGLHVVAEGGKHYWIEKNSRPVLTKTFTDSLGAELVRDDDIFLSAVVGFGSFGLVHSVLFAAVPLYLLERFTGQYDYSQVKTAALTRSTATLSLPEGNETPFHFGVILNPYMLGPGQKGAFVQALYRRAVTDPLPTLPLPDGQHLMSQDLVSIAGVFADAVPEAIPLILQHELEKNVPPTGTGTVLGTPGQQFGDSSPSNGGASTEIGVSLDRLPEALETVLETARLHSFGAPVALRYLRQSDALLAPTCFGPTTCMIEMPGIDSERSRTAQGMIWEALRKQGIPHVFHWGQALPLEPSWVRAGFGEDRVGRWLAARGRFLKTAEGRRRFSNALTDACGLSGP